MDKIRKEALSALVYGRIEQMILDGALAPGERLSKKDLGATLGVSQTPISEASSRLSGEKLLELRGWSGNYVRAFNHMHLRDLFAVRAGLEGVALRLCIEQLPPEQLDKLTRHFDGFTLPMDDAEKRRYMKAAQAFHGQGIFLSNNSFIIAYDRGFDFIMKSYQKGLIREPEKTLAEHQEIIWAIRKRDAQQAPELLIRHNLRTRPFIDERYPKSRPTDDD